MSSRPPDVQGGGIEVGTGRLALLEAQKGPEHELGAVTQSLASIGVRIGLAYPSSLSCQSVLDSDHCSSLIHLEMSQSFLQARLTERVVNSCVCFVGGWREVGCKLLHEQMGHLSTSMLPP